MSRSGMPIRVSKTLPKFHWKEALSIRTSSQRRDRKRILSNLRRPMVSSWRLMLLIKRHLLEAWKVRTKMKIRALKNKFQEVIEWNYQLKIGHHLTLVVASNLVADREVRNIMNCRQLNKRKSILTNRRRIQYLYLPYKRILMC